MLFGLAAPQFWNRLAVLILTEQRQPLLSDITTSLLNEPVLPKHVSKDAQRLAQGLQLFFQSYNLISRMILRVSRLFWLQLSQVWTEAEEAVQVPQSPRSRNGTTMPS